LRQLKNRMTIATRGN